MDAVGDELLFEIQDSGNMLRLEPLELAYPDSSSDFDNNWVKTKINVVGGVFSGGYITELMTVDYEKFKRELSALYNNLKGKVIFADIEGSLKVELRGDGLGHFEVDVLVCDKPCFGAKLNFIISIDQTCIKPMVKQLNEITKRFPITGEFKMRNVDL